MSKPIRVVFVEFESWWDDEICTVAFLSDSLPSTMGDFYRLVQTFLPHLLLDTDSQPDAETPSGCVPGTEAAVVNVEFVRQEDLQFFTFTHEGPPVSFEDDADWEDEDA